MVTPEAMKKGAHAGNLIKAVAAVVGGGGGGRPNMAQAGGKRRIQDPTGDRSCSVCRGRADKVKYKVIFSENDQKQLTYGKKSVIITISAVKYTQTVVYAQSTTGGEVRCESMSNVIVKENETLDSALRRFKT